nr:peptidylprolyl isomerase [candidate division Zixibacteria bacterium]
MKKINILLLALILSSILPPAVHPEMEPIEKIVAIVGRDPIMMSELAAQIQLVAIQGGLRPKNEQELKKLQDDVLDQMISERLFLNEARQDTSIKVTAEDVDLALDDHIARISSQFESEDQFLEQLSLEGLTLRTFKKKLRPEIENQLLKQQLISKKLAQISISRQEVMDFYEKYKDSIPDQPEAIRLAHILIKFQPSKTTEDSVLAEAEKIRLNAVSGADFATLAATYSSGPSALTGGDLGFVAADDVVPEFSRVAFNLSPGDISAPVRTQFGVHIIKCEEIEGKRAHLRHILLEVLPISQDSLLSYKLADSLLAEIRNGANFKENAKVFSADDESRKQGGELGWFAVKDLPPGFQQAMDSLTENGDIYGPVKTDYGLHIIERLDWKPGGTLNPVDNFDQIKEMAKQSKTGEFVDRWLAEIKEKTYVEIRNIGNTEK